MTGTALTEGEEFEKIYELSVLEVPTNQPTIRVDRHDKVYFNQNAKWKFVKQYIKFAHEIGQPILIGTSSIATSEQVSPGGFAVFKFNKRTFRQSNRFLASESQQKKIDGESFRRKKCSGLTCLEGSVSP